MLRISSSSLWQVALTLALFGGIMPAHAGNGGHATATRGKDLAAQLIVIGIADLAADTAAHNIPKIPLDLLEISGATTAMNNNLKTMAETKNYSSNVDSHAAQLGTSLGADHGSDGVVDISTECKKNPGICACGSGPTCKPELSLPKLDDMKGAVTAAYADPETPVDRSIPLTDALAQVDQRYATAQEAIDTFNKLTKSATVDSTVTVPTAPPVIANKSLEVEKPATVAMVFRENKFDDRDSAVDPATGHPRKFRAGKNSLRARGGDDVDDRSNLAQRVAAALADDNSRTDTARSAHMRLSLFDRVTTAIRGRLDRKMTLGKIEFTRQTAEDELK